jgi:hypothetical protein
MADRLFDMWCGSDEVRPDLGAQAYIPQAPVWVEEEVEMLGMVGQLSDTAGGTG